MNSQSKTLKELKETDYLGPVFNVCPDAVIVTRLQDGAFVNVNEVFTRLSGYSPEDLLHKSTLDINLWAKPENRQKMVDELKARGHFEDLESVFIKKDGSRYTGSIFARTIFIQNEPYVISFIRDITKRKQAEEKLKKAEEKYRALAENIKDVIWTLDPETMCFTYLSPTVFDLRGYTAEEIMAQPVDAALTPEGAAYVRELIAKRVKNFISEGELSGKHYVEEVEQPCRDGSLVWTEVVATFYRNQETGRIELRGVTRDITKRKTAEMKLKKTAEEYRLLFENAAEAIVVVQDRALKICNPMTEALCGYSLAELRLIQFWDLIYPDDRETVLDRSSRRLNGEEVDARYEFRIIRKDGTIRWVEINSIRIDWNGRPATLNFLSDITERKLATEEIIRVNEELSRTSREKDKFFSIIAHDLRSPFNSFLGLTQIIAEDLRSMTLDEIQEMAIDLRNSASNLYRLLENLLEWSRMQQGTVSFSPGWLQLSNVVNESLTMALESAKSKNIEIRREIPEDLEIFADTNMLQALIRNLVSNAIKFTPKGGRVCLFAEITGGKDVELSVQDSGIGMDSNVADNLFRPDVKTGRRGTDGEPSTGLGLLICKEFVQRHGGKIWAESEEGSGSRFHFSLPLPAKV